MTLRSLPQELQWPGRRYFYTYVSAFLFYLTSIRIQHERFHEIHESYNLYDFNEDLTTFYSKVNISQDEYFTRMNSFYSGKSNVYVTTLELVDYPTFEFEGDENNATKSRNIIMGFNSSVEIKSSDIVGAEVRMLMPPVIPDENPTMMSPLLTIYDLKTKNKITERKVWLSEYAEKWISVSGPNVIEAVQNWITGGDQEWYINITNLPDIPTEAYVNLVVDEPDWQGCRWSCNEKRENPPGCDWVRRKTPERFGVHCSLEEIPFGEELNQFGVDMTMLTDLFLAPIGLTYTFCDGMNYVRPAASVCTSTKYEHDIMLVPHWDFPWLLTETHMNVNLTDCNCTEDEFVEHVPTDRKVELDHLDFYSS